MTVYTDSTNQVLFEAPKPGNLTANAYDYNFSWRGGGTGLFMDGPTGNVGIGTATPGSYKLNVNGNTNITGTLYVTLGPSVFADIEASNVTASNFTATAVNGTSTLAGGFTVTGNVGIATTTPKPYSLWVGLPLVLWLSSAAVPEKLMSVQLTRLIPSAESATPPIYPL